MTKITAREKERIFAEMERESPASKEMFVKLVRKGESLRMAQMCACKSAPSTRNTDRTFNCEARQVMGEMKPKQRDKIVKIARAAGISTTGKYYLGGLGRYTDPGAWVASIDDAVDTCKREQLTAEGIFNHRSEPVEPGRKAQMAPDILDSYVDKYVLRDGRLREQVRRSDRKLRDLKQEILSTHS